MKPPCLLVHLLLTHLTPIKHVENQWVPNPNLKQHWDEGHQIDRSSHSPYEKLLPEAMFEWGVHMTQRSRIIHWGSIRILNTDKSWPQKRMARMARSPYCGGRLCEDRRWPKCGPAVCGKKEGPFLLTPKYPYSHQAFG